MNRRVLIAHASEERARQMGAECERRGFLARAAANGAEALEVALEEVPDVVVADGALELIDPQRLVPILRANPRTQGIRFVLLGSPAGGARLEGWDVEWLPADAEPEEVALRAEAAAAWLARFDALRQGDEGAEELQGQLGHIALADILQLFQLNRRSGTLELRHRGVEGREERGRIYVKDGEVVQAVAGAVEGEKAFYRLLACKEGSFAFRPGRMSMAPRMAGPTRALLMEGLRQLDEWDRHGPALPPLDGQVVLRVGSAELPSVVHPLTQEVLLLLEIYPRVRDVVDHCSHPDYQVLRTLQTLIERGMVELRRGHAPRPPRSGLFTAAQARRLREWLTRGRGGPAPNGDAKLLLLSPDAAATSVFVSLLADLPGMDVEEPFANRRFSADDLARIGRLAVDRELGIDFQHVPVDPAFAPVWSLASHGALGALLLLAEPVAQGSRVLQPAAETLGALARARLFYVLLADGNEAELSDQVRANVSLLDDSSLFLLPREGAREPTVLLREAFARILP